MGGPPAPTPNLNPASSREIISPRNQRAATVLPCPAAANAMGSKPIWSPWSSAIDFGAMYPLRKSSHGPKNLATDDTFEAEEDALRCAECMGPEIETFLEYAADKFKNHVDRASWALTWGYADLLRQFHGDLTLLERTAATYTEMTA